MTAVDVRAAIEAATAAEVSPNDLELAKEPRNDFGNGRRLKARFGRDLLYVEEAGWHYWTGTHWQLTIGQRGGPGPEAIKRAQATAEAIAAEADALVRDAS